MKNQFLKAMSAVVFIAATAISHIAHAGLIYDESVWGDSPSWMASQPAQLGAVEGNDFILGSSCYCFRPDEDAYGVVLDGTIDGIRFEVVTAQGPGYDWWEIRDLTWDTYETLMIGDRRPLTGVIDVSGYTGDFIIFNTRPSWESYNYKITFLKSSGGAVVGVPETSTLAIFALGMIGLASRRFKKQS